MLVQNNKRYLHKASDLTAYPSFVSNENRIELSRFDHILWVHHRISGVYWPWLTNKEEADFLTRIDSGIAGLNVKERQRAIDMGLVYEHSTMLIEESLFLANLQKCRHEVTDLGYCLIPKITFQTYPYTIDHYVNEINTSLVFDDQVPTRRSQHNAGLFSAVHSQLADLVQKVANTPLKPSYCYMSVYPKGSILAKHTDRAQCVWNASITFSRTDKIWPIYVEGKKGEAALYADIGEVVVYRGTEIPHWRKALPEGTATVCFFHFVDQDYQGVLT